MICPRLHPPFVASYPIFSRSSVERRTKRRMKKEEEEDTKNEEDQEMDIQGVMEAGDKEEKEKDEKENE